MKRTGRLISPAPCEYCRSLTNRIHRIDTKNGSIWITVCPDCHVQLAPDEDVVSKTSSDEKHTRDLSFNEIDRRKKEGFIFPPLTLTIKDKYQALAAAFGSRTFSSKDTAKVLKVSNSCALQTIRTLYAVDKIARIDNGLYQVILENTN